MLLLSCKVKGEDLAVDISRQYDDKYCEKVAKSKGADKYLRCLNYFQMWLCWQT